MRGLAVVVLLVVAALLGRWSAISETADKVAAATATTTTIRPPLSNSNETAGHALERMLNEAELGLFDQLWMEIDPAQQAVIPRQRFVECETTVWQRMATSGYRYVVTDPPEAMGRPMKVFGTDVTRDRVVLVQMGLESDTGGGMHRTNFLGAVDGRWRWIVGSPEVDAYRTGACPTNNIPSFY